MQPALTDELQDIPEDRKTLWTGREFSPRASRIPRGEDDDDDDDEKAQNEADVGAQKLGEGSEG